MRIYLAGILLIGTLSAGCSSDWDPAGTGTATRVPEGDQATTLPTATLAAREGATGFASLPDRGELLSYAKERDVRRSGAYTSHPVEISEAHALNAIAAGGLRLNTPDGKPVNVAFDRIEEHPDGNWTWVGQSDGGDHAVFTFGESAVFGEFSSAGKSYRVTTRRGAAFVVETDPALLAGNNPAHHGDGPEFLIPPPMTDLGEGSAGSKTLAAAASTAELKAAAAVIDLALGYTQGMVATYGNQTTAVTRLTNLVALGNAAYQRSGVNMRLRLVHVLQVNFPDNTDNADALQKLTGYNSSTSQFINPDPAFSALRAARDQYGADLVALVRQHRTPEQKGCGIAWLIGANQRAIAAADAPFGYSVVSDGSDLDEVDNNTYFCSDYSLVHELGHNMGQAHNQGDSQYVGAHSYSYGYRETLSTGFHTIMAYPLANSSQTEAPYFATPTINFAAGRPYGTATSDNVRSMNQTMPVVSTFRDTKVPLVGRALNDLDGDGKSDLFWRHPSTGAFAVWVMNGPVVSQYVNTIANAGSTYSIVGTGDLNADGRADIVWSGQGRDLWLWSSNGSQFSTVSLGSYPQGWKPVALADINSDSKSDIVWRHEPSGSVSIWLMDGPLTTSVLNVSAKAFLPYRVLAAKDFNGDGRTDLLWVDEASRDLSMWLAGDGGFTVSPLGSYPVGWQPVGAEDIQGDGRADILWRHTPTGSFAYWVMNGSSIVRVANIDPKAPASYRVVASGDFNGDGFGDIAWTSDAARDLWVWLGDGNSFSTYFVSSYPSSWSPAQ